MKEHAHNHEVKEHYQQPNPYPKINHGAMRSDAEAKGNSGYNEQINAAAMRKQADRNNDQTAHVNKPIAELNRFDREDGPVKGGC
jgi:hypothetical protein